MNKGLEKNTHADILLQLKNASVQFGGVKALDNVSIAIDEGEMVALMGPNGAGKSTVLKAFFGFVLLHEGAVYLHSQRIMPSPGVMVSEGVAFVPQGRRVFANLTIRENLEVGGSVLRNQEHVNNRIAEVLDFFPVLRRKVGSFAGALSGGEQQMLVLARGLMLNPRVLLLDEPTLGLAPKIVSEVFLKIQEINERHKTAVMIVEHNIQSVLSIVHRGYVLDKGSLVFEGTSDQIIESGILERIFLGAV